MDIYIQKESTYKNIIDKKKIIEGKLNKGIFKIISEKIQINFCFKCKKIPAKIIDIKKYSNFYEFLLNENLKEILPDVKNIEEGIEIYNSYYPNNNNYSVIAIKFSLL